MDDKPPVLRYRVTDSLSVFEDKIMRYSSGYGNVVERRSVKKYPVTQKWLDIFLTISDSSWRLKRQSELLDH